MTNQIKTRIGKLQKKLKQKKLDAIIIAEPYNRRFLSNYSADDHNIGESSGVLLVPAKGSPFLLTDSRFVLQAEKEAKDCDVLLANKGQLNCLKKIVKKLSLKKIGFESNYTLYETAIKRQKEMAKSGVEMVAVKNLVEQMRLVKTEREIRCIKESVLQNEKVFTSIYNQIEPGMTEKEVALAIELTMYEFGAEKPSFSTIVAFGDNSAKPHAVPTDRVLKSGEIVLIDMGMMLKGYCSDMTRTFIAGKPDKVFLKRLRLVRRAQLAAIKKIKAGVTCKEVDNAAREILKKGGYGSYFSHSLGHGVGMNVHEDPALSAKSGRKLKTNMVVTVEPGIYIPDWGGIRLENMVVVKENGCLVLNKDTTELDL